MIFTGPEFHSKSRDAGLLLETRALGFSVASVVEPMGGAIKRHTVRSADDVIRKAAQSTCIQFPLKAP